ncbi:aldo/keto reductase [Companilactobacillus sp.]|jgi:predicted oxidoreductase|uniref:aldo/keto reductase n=1 Tax=Companilactobacillus sp. TaxID=2767905 RepID=UPI0025C3EC02|nr:aldo/keto reductase [Companilactobacillus sp.]MCH4009181.1 aldo/keto reductase [Companilactobacillus sp.]MCH4050640.1 aldo/keto reductase [Companilactobacillus sp.]MCH4077123.1 aldo/keto reductase [Companilactobacillus sp.]MCH4125699.1 aldo/keto reductase [Companilactobacillus sp.]MCI1311408.1 aldo/keto reductase [Companilactobacillus sp.]
MKQLNLGGSNWQASQIAFGAWRMDALSVDQAAKAIDTAYDCGINFVDNADMYGKGESEQRFGDALKKTSVKREDLFIQTKAAIVLGEKYDFSREHIMNAIEGSMKRLGVDYLDSFLLHRPDPLMEPEEVAEIFDDLQKEGKVRHFGVSNFNPQQFLLLQESLNQRLLVNQVQFSLMHTPMIDHGIHSNMADDRSINRDGELIEFSRRMDVTLQAWSPFQYGFFEGVFIDNPKFPELNQELQKVTDKYEVSKNAIAAAWILRHPAKMQVIIGTMNPKHIIDSCQADGIEITRQEWYDLYKAAGNDLP